MRRLCAVFATAIAVFAFTAVPAGAQPDGISDLPTLGFEIDPDRGHPGDTVNGWVDTDDVAEHCITDPEEFVNQFIDLELPNFEDGPYYQPLVQLLDEDYGGFAPLPAENPFEFALVVALLFPLGLALDLPANGGDGQRVEDALFATFVMAFADIETAEPHDPRGNFNPFTGEGSTPVPDLEPGLYPVIATCVALAAELLTYDNMINALELTADYVAENVSPPYPEDIFGDEFAEIASEVAPILIEELVEPQALGIQFYCVLQPDGQCATPPGAVELAEQLLDEELDFEAEAELDVSAPSGPEVGAAPVAARPSFTG